MTGLPVESILPASIADELEIEAGDLLIAVNGQKLRDIIDYSYYTASDCELRLEILKPDGDLWDVVIEREPGEPLGIMFSPPAPDSCANNCLFCFVHQLPPGLRKQLYIKDEDYRLSFLDGNYVTLANLKQADLDRIIEQRLSPLYISVHTTNHHLRQTLLGKQNIPDILDQLKVLFAARIKTHAQIVLCPGLNDGDELERTISDLAELYPMVQSLAVVPLGLTSHRNSLPELQPVTKSYAHNLLATWELPASKLHKRLGGQFLFFADEFYLKAELPFPALRYYGDFPQIENGVGMVPRFMAEARRVIRTAKPLGHYSITVVTGVAAAGFVGEFVRDVAEKTGIQIRLVTVKNKLFGDLVTVSGLVAGNDIKKELSNIDVGSALLVPDVMLKEGNGLFLDDVSLQELEQELDCNAVAFEATPRGFYRTIRNKTTFRNVREKVR